MNYLIVIPRYINTDGEGYAFPLGICYISAVLKKYIKNNIYTINLNHINLSPEDAILNIVTENKIDVVLTGGLCLDYHNIHNLLKKIKEINFNIITIVGGGIITGDPEPAMIALEYADYGIIGEGEESVTELCFKLEGNEELREVKGIIYRDGLKYKFSEKRSSTIDLAEIPWPDYEGFNFKEYMETTTAASVMATKKNTLFMLTSRSCPYRCTFCFHTSGAMYRQRDIDDVFAELDSLIDKYKVEYIFFVDELFGTSIDRLKKFCGRIKKYNLKGWYSYFRVDQITKEKIDLLKESSCKCMFFGLESADNKILKSMNKNITIEQIEAALALSIQEKISFDGCFIFGDSEETYQTALNTLNWWYSHPEYKIMLSPISCYPGTEIYHRAVREGKIADPVKFLKDGCPLINISLMNNDEYYDILNRLSVARKSMVHNLEFVKVVDINYAKHTFTIESKCNTCNNVNLWSNNNMFMEPYLICEACGQKYDMPVILAMLNNATVNLEKILKQYKKVAFWGIGKTIESFLAELNVINNNKIYLVDRNTGVFLDRKIHNPNIIKQQDIEFVIIAVPRYFGNIYKEATDVYGVKHIIDVCQLCDGEFTLEN